MGRCIFFHLPEYKILPIKNDVMNSETNYVKKETFEQMKVELQHMKGIERPAAS